MSKESAGKHGIRRIGVSTGGGDAPGLNAVIRAVVLAARNEGWEVVGIRDGYNGLFLPEQYPDGGADRAHPRDGARHHAPRRHDPRHHQRRQSRSSSP